jgi:hypothetical protein
MGQVSLGRPFSDPQPVDVEQEVIVRAHLDWEVCRLLVQVDDPAEMKDSAFSRRGGWMGNPLRRPVFAWRRLGESQWNAQQ